MAISRAGAWTIAVVVCIVLPAAWVAGRIVLSAADDGPIVLEGARLGMTPAELRRAFVLGPSGTFRSEPAAQDFSVEWLPAPGTARPRLTHARFEFHGGLLVAVRIRGRADDDALAGPGVAQTPGSVIARRTHGDVTDVTMLARDCPTHAAEVASILSSGLR